MQQGFRLPYYDSWNGCTVSLPPSLTGTVYFLFCVDERVINPLAAARNGRHDASGRSSSPHSKVRIPASCVMLWRPDIITRARRVCFAYLNSGRPAPQSEIEDQTGWRMEDVRRAIQQDQALIKNGIAPPESSTGSLIGRTIRLTRERGWEHEPLRGVFCIMVVRPSYGVGLVVAD